MKRKMFEKDKNKFFDQLSGVQVKIFNRKGLIIIKVTLVIIQSHRAKNRSRNDLFAYLFPHLVSNSRSSCLLSAALPICAISPIFVVLSFQRNCSAEEYGTLSINKRNADPIIISYKLTTNVSVIY